MQVPCVPSYGPEKPLVNLSVSPSERTIPCFLCSHKSLLQLSSKRMRSASIHMGSGALGFGCLGNFLDRFVFPFRHCGSVWGKRFPPLLDINACAKMKAKTSPEQKEPLVLKFFRLRKKVPPFLCLLLVWGYRGNEGGLPGPHVDKPLTPLSWRIPKGTAAEERGTRRREPRDKESP